MNNCIRQHRIDVNVLVIGNNYFPSGRFALIKNHYCKYFASNNRDTQIVSNNDTALVDSMEKNCMLINPEIQNPQAKATPTLRM